MIQQNWGNIETDSYLGLVELRDPTFKYFIIKIRDNKVLDVP